jgi:hypothetical protein
VFGDARGFFLESWEERQFASAGIDAKFVQDNHSRSARHILRGLHYQVPHTQGKLGQGYRRRRVRRRRRYPTELAHLWAVGWTYSFVLDKGSLMSLGLSPQHWRKRLRSVLLEIKNA